MIQFEPINKEASSLTFKAYTFRMPKSRTHFLLVQVHGNAIQKCLNEQQIELINFIEEVQSWGYYYSTTIIDISTVQLDKVYVFDLFPNDHFEISKQVAIIRETKENGENENYLLFKDVESALLNLVLSNKKKRFDGGRNIDNEQLAKSFKNFISPLFAPKHNVKLEVLSITFHEKNLFYLKFSGDYPTGSKGESEGKFIGLKLNQVTRSHSIDGIIIDFKHLNYTWGDDIDIYPFQFKKANRPLQFIFNPEQLEYFNFCLKEGEQRISFNEDDACRKLENMLQ